MLWCPQLQAHQPHICPMQVFREVYRSWPQQFPYLEQPPLPGPVRLPPWPLDWYQLLLTYNSVSAWLDEGHLVDLILFDFAKAFDVVSHSVLLDKLRCIGVGGRLLCWIEHFLIGRTMSVMVKDVASYQSSLRKDLTGPWAFLKSYPIRYQV